MMARTISQPSQPRPNGPHASSGGVTAVTGTMTSVNGLSLVMTGTPSRFAQRLSPSMIPATTTYSAAASISAGSNGTLNAIGIPVGAGTTVVPTATWDVSSNTTAAANPVPASVTSVPLISPVTWPFSRSDWWTSSRSTLVGLPYVITRVPSSEAHSRVPSTIAALTV